MWLCFLVGAYQEILGDMHNLFGDTNAVHVSVNEKGIYDRTDYRRRNGGRGVGLCAVQSEETGTYARNLGNEISERRKDFLEEGKEFLSNYRSGLYGYTYLE